jgi:hypothetical protein
MSRPESWNRAEILRNLARLRRMASSEPARLANLRAWWCMVDVVEPGELDVLLSAHCRSDRFLSPEDVRELTGYSMPARQARWLKRKGVHHYVNAQGRPVVTWEALDGRKREDVKEAAPINWEAVH